VSYSDDGDARLSGVSHARPGNTGPRHVTYALDALNRLTNVSYPQGDTASYSYDPNGNRLTKTTTQGGTATYTYDDADQLLSEGTTSYSYDQNGNLLGAGSSVLSWDYANRLATAQVGSTTASYSYDGDGTRTSKTVNGTSTPYLWDRPASGGPLLASDGTSSYLGDPSGESDPIGSSVSLLGQLDAGNTATYYLDDGLGSVRGAVGVAGTLAGSSDYDVFGAARNTSGQQPGVGVGYIGEQTDAETGFEYLHARDYNPLSGRFLSADSVQPNAPGTQGYNRYAYVQNNPTTWADPSGQGIPLSWVNTLGVFAIVPACLSTGWCVHLGEVTTEIYYHSLELVGDSGVGVVLATLGYAAAPVYIATACAVDVTTGPDHLNHCFYVDGSATGHGSTGPCSGPPGAPAAPRVAATLPGPSTGGCGARPPDLPPPSRNGCPSADAPPGDEVVHRGGASPESATRLESQPDAAEKALGKHGVSVTCDPSKIVHEACSVSTLKTLGVAGSPQIPPLHAEIHST
jgi:RHS repeat-associated protein